MITIFENFQRMKETLRSGDEDPDLRKIGEYVLCIKNFHSENRQIYKKDNYYKVGARYGDPQRAYDEFGINDYVPVECTSRVIIFDDNKKQKEFEINPHYPYYTRSGRLPLFFDYFDIPEFTEDISKYNL